MPDVLRALLISSGILSLVVVLIIIISIVTVRRGEAGHVAIEHHAPDHPVAASATAAAAAAPAKSAKAAAPASEEISVLMILLYGTALFVISVLLLLGLSLIQHMG